MEIKKNKKMREIREIRVCGGPIGPRFTDSFSSSPSSLKLKKSPAFLGWGLILFCRS
jgi:hypothetical protein